MDGRTQTLGISWVVASPIVRAALKYSDRSVASTVTKNIHRHLTGKYHSEPNVPDIPFGRVDLRVDHKQFRNNSKIQHSL